jgi:hypothetical protein
MVANATIQNDSSWVRQSFLVPLDKLQKVDQQNRTFSTVSLKFTDTSPGGNFPINTPAQFTRTADIKDFGKFKGSKGMGWYYSEAIDDNSQVIHMRFGVPAFNSMTQFFTNFYDVEASTLARTGRSTSIFYKFGAATGFVVGLLSWKLLAVHLLGIGAQFFFNKPTSKFYYLKPAMPLYWNAVTTMVNRLAVNRGIVPRIGGESQQVINNQYQFTPDATAKLSSLLPDIFRSDGSIDIYSMAGKAQRLAHQREKIVESILDLGSEAANLALSVTMDPLSALAQNILNTALTDKKPDFLTYLASWFNSAPSKPPTGDAATGSSDTESAPVANPGGPSVAGFADFMKSEFEDGTAFASFRVNYTGHVSESFSSTVAESDLQQKLNSMSSSARNTRFDFSNGNLSDGFIGQTIGAAATAAKDLISGVADGLGFSGLAALGGSAFVDIPKHWVSSIANLPHSTYTIELRSPYGNPISQLINIYIPLCMLLAGALPMATGKQTYNSPFLVELYDKGRSQTRLGMIDSMAITRGTTNLGFNNAGHAMGIDVSFSIVDMSSILTMPIAEGFSLLKVAAPVAAGAVGGGPVGAAAALFVASGAFDDDTVYSDYMAVLSGMGLADQIYQFRKLKLNLTRTLADWNSWASVSHFANVAGDMFPARLWSALYQGTSR